MKKWIVPLVAFPLLLAGCSTGSLGGTEWTVLQVLATDETDIEDMDIDFGTNGVVTTTTTHKDGSKETSSRRYHVHGALVSVHRPEGNLDMLHRIDGNEMVMTGENFQARLLRID